MKPNLRFRALLPMFLLVCSLAETRAQGTALPPTPIGTMTTNYYYAKNNELTITVDIIGFVQRPGRYEIANSVNIVNLIALAGGATADGTLGSILITRQIEQGGTITTKDIILDLTHVSRLKPADLVLHPGDVIQIDRSGWTVVRDIFVPLTTVAVIVAAVSQIVYFSK